MPFLKVLTHSGQSIQPILYGGGHDVYDRVRGHAAAVSVHVLQQRQERLGSKVRQDEAISTCLLLVNGQHCLEHLTSGGQKAAVGMDDLPLFSHQKLNVTRRTECHEILAMNAIYISTDMYWISL